MKARSRIFPSHATALAFPLGGIGTGNVSLGARGDLRDWEIFNSPGKGQTLPNSFWALRAETPDGAVTKVLEGPIVGPHTRSHGYHPTTGAGLPRFRDVSFRGEYPFAWIDFADPEVPLKVQLEAFTPLVPLDPAESGIPCALLTFRITNPGPTEADVTIAGSLMNPIGGIAYGQFFNPIAAGPGRNLNEFVDAGSFRGLRFSTTALSPTDLAFGEMSLVTEEPSVTAKPAWLRGRWYDYLREYWQDLSADGRLDDLGYGDPSPAGETDTGSLAASMRIAAGATHEARFYLTWFFPNRRASWNGRADAPVVRNFYATRFESSWDVARYLVERRRSLEDPTRAFHDALFSSTLPPPVVDAISANIVPARSTTCFWLEDGGFYGYEGCFERSGSCAGTCTHVWSYAYTIASLFPSLERRMRLTEFCDGLQPDGYMPFRSLGVFGEESLWLDYEAGRRHPGQRPPAAVDGQLGSIIRAYREWLMSGDREWLAQVWPGIKLALGFVRREWDPDDDGVLGGSQHTTYDIDFVGPNPLCTGYFLAALRAVAELAMVMGEPQLADVCAELATKGGQNAERLMWNGSYYQQRIDEVDAHPYQHGSGCLSDQLLGQLHARILGLGHVLSAAHVRGALQAVFDNNFRRSLAGHVNPQRTFALNDEAGLILCSWPKNDPPRYPFIYSDEVWTGTEYQVAAHMMCEGLVDEGVTLVEATRARHDGIRRNPWDEVECGHHYARSMASWGLLLAMTGFHCDMGRATLRFDPVLDTNMTRDDFSSVWFTGRGWGTYTQRRSAEGGKWVPSVIVRGGDMRGVQVTACGQTWVL